MRQKSRAERVPWDPPEDEVAEAAVAYGVPPGRMESAMTLATELMPEELSLLGELVRRPRGTTRSLFARGLRKTLEELQENPTQDPLSSVDSHMDASEAASAMLWANVESRRRRRELLRECVDSQQAGELTGRSRQAVERLRRDGRILALRVGRQWRYPAWQFDVDGPGGVLPQLDEVVDKLFLSPEGAASWLTRPHGDLGDRTPVERLRARDADTVLRLAEQHGHMP